MLSVIPRFRPPLDAAFLPAFLWQREFRALVAADRSRRPLAVVLDRPDGGVARHDSQVLGAGTRKRP
jgi:hypothetical protein